MKNTVVHFLYTKGEKSFVGETFSKGQFYCSRPLEDCTDEEIQLIKDAIDADRIQVSDDTKDYVEEHLV